MFTVILYPFVFQHVSFHVMSQFGNRMLGLNLNFVHVRDTERHSIDLQPVLSASPSRRTDSSKVAKSDTSLCHFPRQFSGLRCLTDFLTETCFRYLSCFVGNVAQWSEILKYWGDEFKIQEEKNLTSPLFSYIFRVYPPLQITVHEMNSDVTKSQNFHALNVTVLKIQLDN